MKMPRHSCFLIILGLLILPFCQATARYYDARTGRFLSKDPKEMKYPGWSPYAYTLDNPLKYVDPDGRAVTFHASATNNHHFNKAYDRYLKTDLGKHQTERFAKDDKILVIYQVGDMSKTSGKTIGGVTDWKTRSWEDSRQADAVVIGSKDMGIKDQQFDNKGKAVITITVDKELLESRPEGKSAEVIYHEGKAHVEYDRDQGDDSGNAVDVTTEHEQYGTDGVSPIKRGSPADDFVKQEQESEKKEKKQ